MLVEFRLLDQIKLANHLMRNFACEYSEDDRIFILTETGVYVLGLKCDLSNTFPNLCCSKTFFQVSNFISADNVDLDINTFHKDLNRKALYESVIASELSANLKHIKPIDPSPVCATWSPAGIVGRTTCLLGVLTTLHCLEIYAKYIDENEQIMYNMVTNITEEIISVLKVKWKDPTRFPIHSKMEEFKNRVNSVSVSAFTWTHAFKFNGKNNCVIITGMINGDITLWRFEEFRDVFREKVKPYFLGRYATKLGRISSVHWHPTSEFGGGLSLGDISGKVNVLRITGLQLDEAVIDKETEIWPEEDNILVDKLTVVTHENRTYILVAKQNVLIIFGINEEGVIFDQKVEYIEEYYITGICHYKNIVIVLSLTGTMTQFTISGKRTSIVVNRRKIPIKADIQRYRTHGFFFSSNMMLFGILFCPRSLQQLTKLRTNAILYVFNNSSLNPLEILWDNPTNSLRMFWDCFETLRLICLKEKRFPWIGLPSDLNHDDLSLVQLKTLRHIAKLSENVFNVVPRVQHYNIKPFILLHYLVEIKLVMARMKKLFSIISSGQDLSPFQMRSLDIENFFLKEMVLKNILPKMNVGNRIVTEMSEVIEIANELEYPDMMQCGWCGEKIIGASCLPPHGDSRCCFTMMPIFIIPSYKCFFCQSVAHREIENELSVFICPYCDIPMNKLPLDSKQFEIAAKDFDIICEGEVKSVCCEDCLETDTNEDLEDVQGNDIEITIFSDSDDDDDMDDDESQLRLKELYTKMVECSLEDVLALELDGHSFEPDDEDEPSRKVLKVEELGTDEDEMNS